MRIAELPDPFTRAEAVGTGVSPRRLDLALDRGDLTRVAAGLYASTTSWSQQPRWEQHRAMALTARRVTRDAILSHTSAAALLGLPLSPRPPLRATLTLLDDSRTSERDSWRDLHRGSTPPGQVVIRRGIPELVTARTVVDSVRVMAPRDALALLDAALRRGLVTRRSLREIRIHQRRWPGVTVLDAVAPLADGLRESWLESASAWVMSTWSLPTARPQVVVLDARGRFVARVDGLWAEQGVVGEADGESKYLAGPNDQRAEERIARAAANQLRREDRLRDAGLGVVRWGTADLADSVGLHARVASALDQGDPGRVRANYRCSCCRRPLTDCGKPTQLGPRGVGYPQ